MTTERRRNLDLTPFWRCDIRIPILIVVLALLPLDSMGQTAESNHELIEANSARITSNAGAIAANMNSIGANASAISDNRNMIGELSDEISILLDTPDIAEVPGEWALYWIVDGACGQPILYFKNDEYISVGASQWKLLDRSSLAVLCQVDLYLSESWGAALDGAAHVWAVHESGLQAVF